MAPRPSDCPAGIAEAVPEAEARHGVGATASYKLSDTLSAHPVRLPEDGHLLPCRRARPLPRRGRSANRRVAVREAPPEHRVSFCCLELLCCAYQATEYFQTTLGVKWRCSHPGCRRPACRVPPLASGLRKPPVRSGGAVVSWRRGRRSGRRSGGRRRARRGPAPRPRSAPPRGGSGCGSGTRRADRWGSGPRPRG